MAKSHHQEPEESYIAARIIFTLFCLIIGASIFALLIDVSSAYIVIEHGHLVAGFGQVERPPPGSLLLDSHTLMQYPLAIVAIIAIIWVTKRAGKSKPPLL